VRRDAREVAEVEVDPRGSGEGPAGAAATPHDQSFALEVVEDLAHDGTAHAELDGHLALGREAAVLRQAVGGHELADALVDRVADGPATRSGSRHGCGRGASNHDVVTVTHCPYHFGRSAHARRPCYACDACSTSVETGSESSRLTTQ